MAMGHGVEGRVHRAPLDAASASTVASTMQALATPSRLLILDALRDGPVTVSRLADGVNMEQSAVSHQLRILRTLGLVVRQRTGRSVAYALFDHHVAQLLDQAISHVEHLRLGKTDGARIA